MPAMATTGGGMCTTTGPTDVCKTPTPSGPVPMPYPNLAQLNQANPATCPKKVSALNKKVITIMTKIPISSGDEPGSAGGVVSGVFKSECGFATSSNKVMVEGNGAVYQGCMTKQNGANANTVGTVSVVTQQQIIAAP